MIIFSPYYIFILKRLKKNRFKKLNNSQSRDVSKAHNTNIYRRLYKKKLSGNKISFNYRSTLNETENGDVVKIIIILESHSLR